MNKYGVQARHYPKDFCYVRLSVTSSVFKIICVWLRNLFAEHVFLIWKHGKYLISVSNTSVFFGVYCQLHLQTP